MKNSMLRMLIVLTGIFVFSFTVNAQTYEIINESGMSINKVYVSASGSGRWTENVLARDRVLSGESFTISLPRSGDCYYDIKYLASDGNEYTIKRLRTCDNRSITLIPFERSSRPGATD